MLKSPRRSQRKIVAQIENISSGGMCLVSKKPIEVSHAVRGEIQFAKIPTPIPVVMQARWYDKLPGKRGYRIGLKFLL